MRARRILRGLPLFMAAWLLLPGLAPRHASAADTSASMPAVISASPTASLAADRPIMGKQAAVAMTVPAGTNVGKQIQVTIRASGLVDAYAYDLRLSYDAERLAFVDAKPGTSGFGVSPIVKDGQLRLAHTKIGDVKGDSGSVTLFTLRFRAIGQGEAAVRLDAVKLVDSELETSSIPADIAQTVKIGPLVLKDIAGHWAEKTIRLAAEAGFVSGYGDDTFRPNRPVTRAEFVAMLVRALGLPVPTDESEKQKKPADLDKLPAWAKVSVLTAYQAGIVGGFADGTFRGDKEITRTQAIVMLTRAFALKAEPQPGLALPFADAGTIPAYGRAAVAATVRAGLVHGRSGNAFAPLSGTSRAEAVVLILAFADEAHR